MFPQQMVTYLVNSGINDRGTTCDKSWKIGNNLEDKFHYIKPSSFETSTVGALLGLQTVYVCGGETFLTKGALSTLANHCTQSQRLCYSSNEGRTVEVIWNPHIYPNPFSELVRDNPRIRQRKAEYICEEDDRLCPLRGIVRCGGKVVLADNGALGLTREGKALVAIRCNSWLIRSGVFLGLIYTCSARKKAAALIHHRRAVASHKSTITHPSHLTGAGWPESAT